MTAQDTSTALALLRRYEIDVALICAEGLAKLIDEVQEEIPFTNVVVWGKETDPFSRADVQLSATASAAKLRETLKQASCRKRGPATWRHKEVECVAAAVAIGN